MKTKLRYEEVLRRTKGFRKDQPKIFQNLIEQFKNMSKGGNGGRYFQSNSHVTVREHYYSDWADEDFVRLLKDLKEYR